MKRVCYLLLLFVSFSTLSYSQDKSKLQVVSFDEEKTISNKNISLVKINGRKSNVTIKGWNKNDILVKYHYTAKNIDKTFAEQDIKAYSSIIKEDKNNLIISVAIKLKNHKGPASTLKCEIEIFTPNSQAIELENEFGNNSLTSQYGDKKLKLKYGTLSFNDVKGKCNLDCYYNDVTGSNIDMWIDGTLENSNLELSKIKGDGYRIKGNFCKIEFNDIESIKLIILKVDNSDIKLDFGSPQLYKYNIKTQAGTISNYLPESITKKSINTTYEFNYKPASIFGEVTINGIYTDIHLK